MVFVASGAFFFPALTHRGSEEEGELRRWPAGLFLFPLSGLCENTFKSGRSLIASIE